MLYFMGRLIHATSVYLCLVLAFSCIAQAETGTDEQFTATVVAVGDGDTLTVKADRRTLIVRLAEIDAPETAQPYGYQATEALSDLALGKKATVTIVGATPGGSALAWVDVGDFVLNLDMVRFGHAWVDRLSATTLELYRAERHAQDAGSGLWALRQAERVPPWEWRARQGLGTSTVANSVDDIIGMHRAGLSDDAIFQQVRTSERCFIVAEHDVSRMTTAGVSELLAYALASQMGRCRAPVTIAGGYASSSIYYGSPNYGYYPRHRSDYYYSGYHTPSYYSTRYLPSYAFIYNSGSRRGHHHAARSHHGRKDHGHADRHHGRHGKNKRGHNNKKQSIGHAVNATGRLAGRHRGNAFIGNGVRPGNAVGARAPRQTGRPTNLRATASARNGRSGRSTAIPTNRVNRPRATPVVAPQNPAAGNANRNVRSAMPGYRGLRAAVPPNRATGGRTAPARPAHRSLPRQAAPAVTAARQRATTQRRAWGNYSNQRAGRSPASVAAQRTAARPARRSSAAVGRANTRSVNRSRPASRAAAGRRSAPTRSASNSSRATNSRRSSSVASAYRSRGTRW